MIKKILPLLLLLVGTSALGQQHLDLTGAPEPSDDSCDLAVFSTADDDIAFTVSNENLCYDTSENDFEILTTLCWEGTTDDDIDNCVATADPTSSDGTWTLIDLAGGSTNFVGHDTTQTLTNKTLAAAGNVIEADTGDSATGFFSAGTLEHERGGLEADVNAYAGLVKISGGATSSVTDSDGLRNSLSDETGTGGGAVFATSPRIENLGVGVAPPGADEMLTVKETWTSGLSSYSIGLNLLATRDYAAALAHYGIFAKATATANATNAGMNLWGVSAEGEVQTSASGGTMGGGWYIARPTGTVTTAYGLRSQLIGGATTGYGLHVDNSSDTSTTGWGIYQDGAAGTDNALESNTRIGGLTAPTEALDVTGNIAVSGTVDGVDVAAHDHDGGDGESTLGTDTVGATQISTGAVDEPELLDDGIEWMDINYGQTVAGNPAMGADECFFATGGGMGFICEGNTGGGDTDEMYFIFPSLDETDTTHTILTETATQNVSNKSISGGTIILPIEAGNQTTDGDIDWDSLAEVIEVGDDSVGTKFFYPVGDFTASNFCTADGSINEIDCGTAAHGGTDITADLEEEGVTCTDCINATEVEDIYLFNTGDTLTTGNLVIDGVDVDYNTGTGDAFPLLLNDSTPDEADCDAAGEYGRIVFDSDLDGAGSVMVCTSGGWKDVDDDGSGGMTDVGDCSSTACFNGTAGTTLTFNNAGGDATLDFDGTDFRFEESGTGSIVSAGSFQADPSATPTWGGDDSGDGNTGVDDAQIVLNCLSVDDCDLSFKVDSGPGDLLREMIRIDTDTGGATTVQIGSPDTNYINVTEAGVMTVSGSATITATDGDSATSFFSTGEIEDARVVDTLTASNYLPLAGGTMTAEFTADDLGVEFAAGDTLTDCSTFSATGGGIFFDDSEGIFKKCQDNVLTDLDTGSGTVNTADIADVNVTQTEFAELETIGETTISAAQWTGLGSATTAGIALWDDADAAAQRTTLNVDVAGTDNSTDVTLAGTPDYITISGQVITRGSVDLAADVTGELPDGNVANTITASNYLPLAGGTLTGETVADDLGVEFTPGDTLTDCSTFSATGGGIFFDDSEGIFKKCQDNVLTDLDTGGTINTADIADVSVTQTEFAELETIGATTISAAQWTGLGGATTAGIALWDDADAAAQRTTLNVDVAGTDNSTDVTLAGTPDYITISGQVITRGSVDLAADVTGELPDGNVSDTITASNYLPLAGGTLTGEAVADDLGVEFTPGDTLTDCSTFAATGGGIFYDDSEGKFKKCQDNVLTDMDTSGGSPSFDSITGGTNTSAAMVVGTGASLAVTGSGTISATEITCTDCVADGEVVDTITASNYLPLSGGTLTGESTVDDLGLEFTAGDTLTDCTTFSATGGGIFYDDSEGKFKKCQDNSLTDLDTGGVTNPTFFSWGANDNVSSASGTATPDYHGTYPVRDFDDAATEEVIFAGVMPNDYDDSSGFTVYIWFTMSGTPSSGEGVCWDVTFERGEDGVLDLDADTWYTTDTQGVCNADVDALEGLIDVLSVTFSHANADSIVGGESFRLKVERDYLDANDDADEDAELYLVELRGQQ